MSPLLRNTKTNAGDGSNRPYPCWSEIANGLGPFGTATTTKCRTAREADIWRALADEPTAEHETAIKG